MPRESLHEVEILHGVFRTLFIGLCLITTVAFAVSTAAAQSPNTATMIVTVVDQNDAVVPGAAISVMNLSTGSLFTRYG